LSVDGKMMAASMYGKADTIQETIEFTAEEKALIPIVETIWKNILNMGIENNTHFFQSGAGSMDVVR
jgi:formyltetrahydrofolate dehydrogenase